MMSVLYEKTLTVDQANSVTETQIANWIEDIQDHIGMGIKTSVKRKLFTTMIELVQNINFYTCSLEGFTNYCTLRQYNDYFEIESNNLIKSEDRQILGAELLSLTKLDNEQISNLLFSTLDNNVPAKSNKNGLGLICIFNHSKEVAYNFKPVNANLFEYNIKVSI